MFSIFLSGRGIVLLLKQINSLLTFRTDFVLHMWFYNLSAKDCNASHKILAYRFPYFKTKIPLFQNPSFRHLSFYLVLPNFRQAYRITKLSHETHDITICIFHGVLLTQDAQYCFGRTRRIFWQNFASLCYSALTSSVSSRVFTSTMKSLVLIFACVIVIAHCESLGSDDEWLAFKAKYSKHYGPDEDMYRKEIWRANLKVRFYIFLPILQDVWNISYRRDELKKA